MYTRVNIITTTIAYVSYMCAIQVRARKHGLTLYVTILELQICCRCRRVQIEAFYLLLNVLPRMEVKEAIVAEGIIPLLIKLLTGENGTLVRQASQTIHSLCEVSEYRDTIVDGGVFESLTAGMKQMSDKDARVAIAETIGGYEQNATTTFCYYTFIIAKYISAVLLMTAVSGDHSYHREHVLITEAVHAKKSP